jgi:hypothetical protein
LDAVEDRPAFGRNREVASRTAAPLESRRKELARREREARTADVAAVSARAEAYGGDLSKVRLRTAEVQQVIEATRGRLRADADAAVKRAIDQRLSRQTEYDDVAKEVTAAETTLNLARQQSDSEEVARLRARLAEIGEVLTAMPIVAEASKVLEEAKTRQTTSSTKADTLRVRLDEMRPSVEQRVKALDGDLKLARQRVQQSLDDIAAELATVDRPDTGSDSDGTALERATKEHDRLTQQFASDRSTLETATKNRSDAEGTLAALETDAAARRGQLTAINRPVLESRLQKATSSQVFQIPDSPELDFAAAQATFEGLQQQQDRCTNDLNHARGQLHLIAGHVGSERLAQQQETVDLAHAEALERERTERAALRLLREIENVEAQRATHLGRALAGPITDAFRALTGGRYGPISLAPDLKTEHIEAHGGTRQLEHVSVGTREQLATLNHHAKSRCAGVVLGTLGTPPRSRRPMLEDHSGGGRLHGPAARRQVAVEARSPRRGDLQPVAAVGHGCLGNPRERGLAFRTCVPALPCMPSAMHTSLSAHGVIRSGLPSLLGPNLRIARAF